MRVWAEESKERTAGNALSTRSRLSFREWEFQNKFAFSFIVQGKKAKFFFHFHWGALTRPTQKARERAKPVLPRILRNKSLLRLLGIANNGAARLSIASIDQWGYKRGTAQPASSIFSLWALELNRRFLSVAPETGARTGAPGSRVSPALGFLPPPLIAYSVFYVQALTPSVFMIIK